MKEQKDIQAHVCLLFSTQTITNIFQNKTKQTLHNKTSAYSTLYRFIIVI